MGIELSSHVGTNRKIRVKRCRPANSLLNGYLLDTSRELALMHCFDDFEPDGYTVFKISDVVEVRSGEYERHWDRMLIGENLLDGIRLSVQVDLSTWATAIRSIHAALGRVIVECEDDAEPVEDFYIGSLVRLEEALVVLDHFNGLGEWASDAARIAFEEITMIQFDTPYINRFWKYVRGDAPHAPRA